MDTAQGERAPSRLDASLVVGVAHSQPRLRRRGKRHAPSPQCLFRPYPDEELARRVVALWAHELRERTLDLGPGLLLFGAAEPGHKLAQGKGPSGVLMASARDGKRRRVGTAWTDISRKPAVPNASSRTPGAPSRNSPNRSSVGEVKRPMRNTIACGSER